jgi:hypothetical protein
MTSHAGRLGIDINIVDRDVKTYPTEKQTGTEFLELFSHAGRHFKTVMVYSEKSMYPQDANLVSYALASNAHGDADGYGIRTNAPISIVYRSGLKQADFAVDGISWPCVNDGDVILPAGSHSTAAGPKKGAPRPHLIKLNGDLVSARYGEGQTIEFSYNADRRAVVIFDFAPKSLQVDSEAAANIQTTWAMIPRGSHKVRAVF